MNNGINWRRIKFVKEQRGMLFAVFVVMEPIVHHTRREKSCSNPTKRRLKSDTSSLAWL